MHAVVRETSYASDQRIHETNEFQRFQSQHARLRGYAGTVVVEAGGGRFLTLTLWDTAEDMNAAREAMGPVVERFLDPLMTAPTRLLGTGAVVLNDLVKTRDESR